MNVEGRSLLPFPAVHYRATFAEKVHQACADRATRPDAIAVELGPRAVAAIVEWLTELGVGPRKKSTLPCMLGLLRFNRRIHPEKKSMAVRLQQVTGQHVHEISPSILRRHLGYSALSLLCLSPTDSIIEAIRCALELEVPVYGIDLEDFAQSERSPLMIEDPIAARDQFSRYVARNARFCESARDPTIDSRREFVIAARLKALMKRHRRVLLTCGLAHWRQLHTLLIDASVRAADDVSHDGATRYHRVLVHPILATYQMDIFPQVTAWYESRREPANKRQNIGDFIDCHQLLRGLLIETYREYFIPSDDEDQLTRKSEDYENLAHFELLLSNSCAIAQRVVSNMFDVLEVAEAMMSPRFRSALATTLMDFGWASPSEWPNLPVVGPDPKLEGETSGESPQRVRLGIPEKRPDQALAYKWARPLFVSCMPEGEGRRVSVHNPWRWEHEPGIIETSNPQGQPRVWPPNDLLLFGTAYQAGQVAHGVLDERKVEPFEGSLFDGVDIKATLRASIRGDRRIYVRRNPPTAELESAPNVGLEPTVFIFGEPRPNDKASWYVYSGSMTDVCRGHVKDPHRLDDVVRRFGDEMVEGVGFNEDVPVPEQLQRWVVRINLLRGITVFGSPSLNAIQEARWLEDTNYTGSPIAKGGGIGQLVAMYRERHHMRLDVEDWPTTLIRLAIPYSRQRVVVVAPDHFVLRPIVFQEARMRRRQLAVLPLSYFSAETILKLTRQHIVRPEDKDGLRYSAELERLLEQSVSAYSDLLPRHLVEHAAADRS